MNREKIKNRFVRLFLSRPGLAAGAGVLILVLAIYARSLWFGYVNYDDGLILSKRWIEYRQLSWEGLVNMFSFMGMTSYQPLRHLALAVVYRLWGLDPFGYHLFNLLFYLLNIWVVFLLLRKLLVICGGFENSRLLFWSWAGTAWFAVHPVHVESVAWMLSNKELLAGLFYFLALLSYLKSWERGFSTGQYLASWVFLALGMLSKPNVAALPLVIIAFEVLFRRRDFDWKLFALRVVPFLALVGTGAVYYIFYTSAFTGILHGSLRIHSLSFASVLSKYVKLLLLPVNLCNSYPPPYFTGEYNYRLAIYLLVDLGIFTALAYALLKGRKAIAFAILFFLLNLLPVSGIFPISIFMADRYLYLSSLGFILAGVVLLSGLRDSLRAGARARRWLALGGVSAVIALTVLASVRCRDWKDGISLWGSAARTYPNFQFNHYALGVCLHRAGRLEEALVSFQKTNMFHEHLLATYHIAKIMDEMGDSAAAEDYYSRVARLYTKDVGEERMLATVYERLGKPELAARVWLESGKKYLYLTDEVKNSVRQLMRG
ncbi:MAG: hypothetical protein JXQ83_02120, partial [Candidatus Glassbacteria bacterium]|nr:hypothetical protein [Candidatus Glassbacteria bacterium]